MANSQGCRTAAAYVMLLCISAYTYLLLADANGFPHEETLSLASWLLVLLIGVWDLFFAPPIGLKSDRSIS